MMGSEILEVAIGIIFIYVLISLICSAVREGIESRMKTRAAYLARGIRELLHDRGGVGLARDFYEHPLIASLYAGSLQGAGFPARDGEKPVDPTTVTRGGALPSYIPSTSFAIALMDMAARGVRTDAVSADPEAPTVSLASVRANVLNLQNPAVQRVLLTAIDAAQGDLNRAVANLAAWYDSGMDRVSGWYKRSTQRILFYLGLFIAIALNVDTLSIADYLYRNDAARTALVARAEAAARDSNFVNQNFAEAKADIDSIAIPLGWGPETRTGKAWRTGWDAFGVALLLAIPGWLMTAFAATLGAPFWFDVLNKVMVIRSTVKPHEKSPAESSEDRQKGSRPRVNMPPVGEQLVDDGTGSGGTGFGLAGGAVLAVQPPGAPPPLPPPEASAPRDAESDVDACDVEMDVDETPDEDLPAAEGGVA